MPRRLEIEVRGDAADFTRNIRRAAQEVQGLGTRSERSGKGVRRLGDDAERAGRKSKTAARGFAALKVGLSGLVAGLGIGVFTRFVTEAAEFGASLANVSDAAGTTVQELQELRRAFAEGGASSDIIDRSIIRLNTSLSRSVRGLGEYAEIFTRLGVEATDGAGAIRSASDVLDDLAGRINASNLQQYQADLALVFGERVGGIEHRAGSVWRRLRRSPGGAPPTSAW